MLFILIFPLVDNLVCLFVLWKTPYLLKMIADPISDSMLRRLSLGDGLDIAYLDEGAGPATLLLVHGMDSNLLAWGKNWAALRSRYRCIALDLPNHGHSGKGLFPFTASWFAGVLLRFMDALELASPVLVGHSMGGQAVLRCLVEQPGRFEKAVLVAPAGLETFSEEEVALLGQLYTPEVIRSLTARQIRKNVEHYFHEFPPDAAFMLEDRLALRKAPHYDLHCEMIPRCVLGMVSDPIHADLGRIEAEVLVFFGENDRLIPHPKLHARLSTSELALREVPLIPGGRLALLPGTGHFLQWEQPEAFAEQLGLFLSGELVNPPRIKPNEAGSNVLGNVSP